MAVIEQWVGLDVCKRWLDVPLRPQGARFRVSHNESGRQALLKRLQVPGSVGRLLWEATGGSERQAALQWWALDYPVVVMHARQHTRLQSVPGVGQVVAATLWALLPARGQLSTPPMSPLVGVAPRKRDSGPRQGKRTLAGGRAAVRQRLYRATLVAVRPHPVIQAVDDQWRQRGKATKVALVACRHK